MKLFSLSPIMLLTGVLAAPAALTATGNILAPVSVPTPMVVQADDMNPLAVFPLPSGDLEIQIGGEATPSMADVLLRFEALSAHNLHISEATMQELKSVKTGLSSSVKVPAKEVYSYISALLSNSGYMMAETRAAEPRIMSIFSMNSHERNNLRSHARTIDIQDIARYERHPALLVETIIAVKNIDGRQLSNSMRSAVVDPNIQMVIPFSTGNLLLVGTGPQVADWIRLIRVADQNDAPKAPAQSGPSGGEKSESFGGDK
jgi:hypothetical protein